MAHNESAQAALDSRTVSLSYLHETRTKSSQVVLTSMEMAEAQREMLRRARDKCQAEVKRFSDCTKVDFYDRERRVVVTPSYRRVSVFVLACVHVCVLISSRRVGYRTTLARKNSKLTKLAWLLSTRAYTYSM